ncbi:hypothetical protein [Foetidibacter luteolus]|uniref:hypothetical protein n=1 Tax=Foetidibacter luteolus TaxID=2608880 RepID=UPI00129B3F48|nr:hypothetical protein [Foetidibacter luteolus]
MKRLKPCNAGCLCILTILLLFTNSDCPGQPAQAKSLPAASKDSQDSVQYVILNNLAKDFFDSACKPAALSESEIAVIDSLTKEQMKTERASRAFDSYKRQFIVVTDSQGDKLVYVNGFCNWKNQTWLSVFVQVDDGGNCFYQMRLNLSKKKVSFFSYNGYA